MNYLGDLNNQSLFGKVNLAGGINVRYTLDTRWAISGFASYGHISGGNPDVLEWRNLSFRSNVIEGGLRAEFNFLPYGQRLATQKRATPFIFCGIGVFHFNPQASLVDSQTGEVNWYDLQPLATEGQGTSVYPDRQKYQLTEVCMPFGIGMRCRLTQAIHLTVEYGFRKTWTDYLDDVSTTYVGREVLTGSGGGGTLSADLADRSPIPNAQGIKRGDDSLDDWYSFFNISISVSMETLFGWMRGPSCEIK